MNKTKALCFLICSLMSTLIQAYALDPALYEEGKEAALRAQQSQLEKIERTLKEEPAALGIQTAAPVSEAEQEEIKSTLHQAASFNKNEALPKEVIAAQNVRSESEVAHPGPCIGEQCLVQGDILTLDPFQEAMTELSVAGEVVNNIARQGVHPNSLFDSKLMECKRVLANAVNCCRDSGWARDVHLMGCSAEELAVGLAKQQKMVHFIDVRRHRGNRIYRYCVFNSKLGRIINEAYREQNGIGWGNYKHPDCSRTISIEQLQNLDWSKIPIHEIYEDVQKNIHLPQAGTLQQKVQTAIIELMRKEPS